MVRTLSFAVSTALISVLALSAPASAQSTYLTGEDDEVFRAMEQEYDPSVIHTARAAFEAHERLLNNHAPLEEIIGGLRGNAGAMFGELIDVDRGCAMLLLGRMSEVTAMELDDRAFESSSREAIWEVARQLLVAAAESYQRAANVTGSYCHEAATLASVRRPAPEPDPEPETGVSSVHGAFGGLRSPAEGSGDSGE